MFEDVRFEIQVWILYDIQLGYFTAPVSGVRDNGFEQEAVVQ